MYMYIFWWFDITFICILFCWFNITCICIYYDVLYRYIIYLFTSLSLNSVEVSKKERDTARRIYDQEQEKIRETVAFGRRSEGPPTIFYSSSDKVLRSTSGMYKCLNEEKKLSQLVQKNVVHISHQFCFANADLMSFITISINIIVTQLRDSFHCLPFLFFKKVFRILIFIN